MGLGEVVKQCLDLDDELIIFEKKDDDFERVELDEALKEYSLGDLTRTIKELEVGQQMIVKPHSLDSFGAFISSNGSVSSMDRSSEQFRVNLHDVVRYFLDDVEPSLVVGEEDGPAVSEWKHTGDVVALIDHLQTVENGAYVAIHGKNNLFAMLGVGYEEGSSVELTQTESSGMSVSGGEMRTSSTATVDDTTDESSGELNDTGSSDEDGQIKYDAEIMGSHPKLALIPLYASHRKYFPDDKPFLMQLPIEGAYRTIAMRLNSTRQIARAKSLEGLSDDAREQIDAEYEKQRGVVSKFYKNVPVGTEITVERVNKNPLTWRVQVGGLELGKLSTSAVPDTPDGSGTPAVPDTSDESDVSDIPDAGDNDEAKGLPRPALDEIVFEINAAAGMNQQLHIPGYLTREITDVFVARLPVDGQPRAIALCVPGQGPLDYLRKHARLAEVPRDRLSDEVQRVVDKVYANPGSGNNAGPIKRFMRDAEIECGDVLNFIRGEDGIYDVKIKRRKVIKLDSLMKEQKIDSERGSNSSTQLSGMDIDTGCLTYTGERREFFPEPGVQFYVEVAGKTYIAETHIEKGDVVVRRPDNPVECLEECVDDRYPNFTTAFRKLELGRDACVSLEVAEKQPLKYVMKVISTGRQNGNGNGALVTRLDDEGIVLGALAFEEKYRGKFSDSCELHVNGDVYYAQVKDFEWGDFFVKADGLSDLFDNLKLKRNAEVRLTPIGDSKYQMEFPQSA